MSSNNNNNNNNIKNNVSDYDSRPLFQLPSSNNRTTITKSDMENKIRNLPREVRNLIAGGIAGMIAKSVVAPIDRIKILYQVTPIPFRLRDIPKVAYSIIQTEGTSALWKGNTATLIRVFPYSGIQFMLFDKCKLFFLSRKEEHSTSTSTNTRKNHKWNLSPLESLMAGSTAGAVSVIFTYPLDLTRAQLAVLKKKKRGSHGIERTKTFGEVLTGNFNKGGIGGLFRGITPTLIGILPYSGIAFTINEQAKRKIYQITNRDPTTIERLQCGALSGLIAQSMTYPLEVTRRRMQTIGIVPTAGNEAAVHVLGSCGSDKQQLPKHKIASPLPNQSSMTRTIIDLMNEQGLRGFFKGVSMNWLKGPVAFSISFTTFDFVQHLMKPEHE